MKMNFNAKCASKIALLILVASAGFFGVLRAVDAWHYATSDSIQQSQIDTERILARFERSGDSTELRRWITDGPTEAPGTQRNLTLGAWAQKSPEKFARVLEGLNSKQRAIFIESFCASVDFNCAKSLSSVVELAEN